jgi:hypothetical protein
MQFEQLKRADMSVNMKHELCIKLASYLGVATAVALKTLGSANSCCPE